MAHKTFISYKYSEARDLRDDIIDALGDDASWYQGETNDSPDLTDLANETIKEYLKDMLFDTSVTIVIISPNMTDSHWIDWEVSYSLKIISKKDYSSRTNGVVGVIQKVNGGYDWFRKTNWHSDGTYTYSFDMSKVYPIIRDNHFNGKVERYVDGEAVYDWLNGSYISFITEEEFLNDPHRFIDNAFDKSQNDGYGYELSKEL